MDVQDLMVLLSKASAGNRVDRANAARILTHAFPLMTWEPGEEDVLVRGKGLPPMSPDFCLEIRQTKPQAT